ncbi:sensor histidine kinase [Azospirillum doebereinerae]|uniref:sensor histidine kinase n=1 Tax=Azospirillum doebereinerae TaxID=92933 RepID=UPI001EE5501A|nr:sensor histidine kinase [Azospirillum doebereinerae]MCG5238576.1 sensor histidine kinase [Azospirillum doebereinerae]
MPPSPDQAPSRHDDQPRGDQSAAPPARIRRTARRLGVGATLIAVSVAVLLLAAGYRAHRDAESEILSETETLTDMAADHTARFIEAADLMLDRLRQLGEQTEWNDPAQSVRLTAELRRLRGFMPAAIRLGVWDGEGKRLTSTEDELPAGFSIADRPYFIAHATGPDGESRGLAISEPMTSKLDGSTILVLSRRLNRPDGSFAGIVTLSFNPIELVRHPLRPHRNEPLSIRWMRDDQQPLAAEGPLPGTVGIAAQSRVGSYPLLVETRMPENAVRERWLARVYPYLALGLVVLFGFGASAWMLLRWASTEDVYRSTLATLATRLRRSNADLEERVDERTKALSDMVAQRDLLLKEVNHRLKNSLQLACALVQMQGQSVTGPEARQQLADTVARLQAIARVHDQLYQTEDVRRVAAATYLHSLCADLEQSALASQRFWRIIVAADESVELPTDQAVPVGLMVNELVTNALKHGQPTASDGNAWTVEVGLVRIDDGQGGGQLRLSVRDHGPGLPGGALPRKDGSLGMKLLNGLTRQLNASLAVENAAPGARIVVTFRPQDVA